MIPVLGFAAYSGTGKTTLIEQIIPRLKNEGIRLAVIKHDAHGLKFDKEGKDSWRFSNAGADYSLVNARAIKQEHLIKSASAGWRPEKDFRMIRSILRHWLQMIQPIWIRQMQTFRLSLN